MPAESEFLSSLGNFGGDAPTGLDFLSNIDFGNADTFGMNWPSNLEMESGWPGNVYGAGGFLGGGNPPGGGGGLTWPGWGMDALKGIGWAGKTGFDAWQNIERQKQMADYNDQYAKWVQAQNDYIKQKQQWESDFMGQFAGAQEKFAGAQEEFQGQLGAASEQANQVFNEFMQASKPLLAQSQEMMTGAVEALARGETPEHWQPILDQAKQRAMASGIQSLIAGGMSPEAAQAAMQPIVDQQAQTMVMQLGDQLTKSGLAAGAQGMQGLQGAGQMTQILGQLAQMGMVPEMQEFQAMASVLGHILNGGTGMVPPGKPSA